MSRVFLVFLLFVAEMDCTAIQRAEDDFSVIDLGRWLSKGIVSISFDLQLSVAIRGCCVGRDGRSECRAATAGSRKHTGAERVIEMSDVLL